MPPLLIAGLDGATWDLIGPWADSGELPLFKRLREEGAWGALRSVTPNLTPPGWTTAFTGVNPGKHGIYDFFALDPGSRALRVVSSADRRAPALWEILGQRGIRCGVFNVPTSYPADEVPGFFVTGMGTPGFVGRWAHPEEEGARIRREHPAFRFGTSHEALERGDLHGFLDELYAFTDVQEEVALDLVRRHAPRVLTFVYDDLDRVMHFFWRFADASHPRHEAAEPRIRDAIKAYYKRLEQGIQRLRDAMGPETDLCVLSDHGFGPLHTDVHLNRTLASWGYLAPLPVAAEVIQKPLWKRTLKKAVPQAARTWLRKNVKASPLGNPLGFIDWAKTRAFYASVSGRSVYVNLKGRQPEATVEPGREYDALRAELKERLLGLKDPATGNLVVSEVYYREEVYRGPHVESAPDLLLQEDGRYAYKAEWSDADFAPASQYGADKSGSHRPDGILVFHGRSFRKAKLDGAQLQDVTPTLLAALGLPAGEEMDGRALEEALATAPDLVPIPYTDTRGSVPGAYSSDEEAQLAERLRGLGYM